MNSKPVVRMVHKGPVGLILIDRKPVNAIDQSVRAGLIDCINELESNSQLKIGIIACDGKTFCTGADMKEFDTGVGEPDYRSTFGNIEQCSKPIIAAIHGMALGGGLELALACHYRLAVEPAQLGMPEITLGVLPGAGATQRLPRIIGALAALNFLLSGRSVKASKAKEMGLLDAVVSGDIIEGAIDYANQLVDSKAGVRPTSSLEVDIGGFDEPGIKSSLAAHARTLRGRTTQNYIVAAIQAATTEPFEQGLNTESTLAMEALDTLESRALRYAFFAERAVGKLPGAGSTPKPQQISQVAIIGAGTMGSGIAVTFADAGFSVTLIDSEPQGLERGKKLIRSVYQGKAKKMGHSDDEVDTRVAKIHFSLDMEDIGPVDLVIEAVIENLEVKKQVFADIDRIVGPQAIIASNTSSLSINQLAPTTSRPGQVIGLHFFSPAHVMPLLEIVRGDETTLQTLSTAMDVARRIRKIGVVSGDGFGFIGNRMMLDGYFREAEQLLLEGASPEQVDRVMEDFGFAMGPSRVNDMGGVDIGTAVRQQLFLRESREDPYCVVSDALTAQGRLGQKTGSGFYSYKDDPRKGVPDPEVDSLIKKLAEDRAIVRRSIPDDEIVERCLLQLINVGAAVLEEGVAYRSSDIDVVWLAGYGFPRYKGGPMFLADEMGLAKVAERIRHYHRIHGGYWKITPLIEQLAERSEQFSAYMPAQSAAP